MRGSQWAFCASLPYLIRTGPSMLSPKGTMRGVPASAHSCSKMNFCTDRKSTRLNSSHLVISYAVFCLKKKKNKLINLQPVHGCSARTTAAWYIQFATYVTIPLSTTQFISHSSICVRVVQRFRAEVVDI